MKPKLVVNSLSLPAGQELRGIRVRIRPNITKSEDGRAFFVEVKNDGRRTADDLTCFACLSGQAGLFPLVILGPDIRSYYDTAYPETEEEFQRLAEPFADALIRHTYEKEESTTLYPKGLSRAFILFFTLRGKNAAYLPSESSLPIPAPAEFRISLAFQTRDQPLHESKAFDVTMRSWDSFDVVEVKKSRFQFLRKSPK